MADSILASLDHVQLAMPAGGEDQARWFYAEVLGLIEVPKPVALQDRGGCWFEGSGISLHLGVDPNFRPARKSHVAMVVHGLDVARLRLATHGIEVTEEDVNVGVRRFYANDPFGNRLEFLAGPIP